MGSKYINDQQEVVAHYEYDAFGGTAANSGFIADYFEHRFSTKPIDEETGFYYYGYRYYDPVTGRWPSRDPIAEQGGVNLYGFVGNRPMISVDFLGLKIIADDRTRVILDQLADMDPALADMIYGLENARRYPEEEPVEELKIRIVCFYDKKEFLKRSGGGRGTHTPLRTPKVIAEAWGGPGYGTDSWVQLSRRFYPK